MLYSDSAAWRAAPNKRVSVFGMSGLGKTHLASMLRSQADWFHYSIDYRIGTRYLDEQITDNAKAYAMQVPFLRELLISDSIYIGSNITFHNLSCVASYLGKPGNPQAGGLLMDTYQKRQGEFRDAEIAALLDTPYFATRSEALYGYAHFICDTGGSICEWVNPDDDDDPIMRALSQISLPVWIEGDEAHTAELIRRFDAAPKPMAYQAEFLQNAWRSYLDENNLRANDVDPDSFIRWTYARALAHRQPRYAKMARWGVSVSAREVADLKTPADFEALISIALERRTS